MRWTLIVERQGRSGAENMGIDAMLLQLARRGDAFLRLYAWNPPCLSFGRNEPVTRRYDLERIKAEQLDTVRRPTGGRAVWHDREVTYAVAAPTGAFGSLAEAYHRIHQVIAAGLATFGLDLTLAQPPRRRAPRAGSCFGSPMGGEILAGGRKLVGSAQYRHQGALLQHGSILLENGQHVVSEFLVDGGAPPNAVSLSELVDRTVTWDEVADAVSGAARSTWEGRWECGDGVGPGPEVAAFRDPAWTWRR